MNITMSKMTNLDWFRTLSPNEIAWFFYVFWEKEQCKYNDSYGALIYYLEQERDWANSNELANFIPYK